MSEKIFDLDKDGNVIDKGLTYGEFRKAYKDHYKVEKRDKPLKTDIYENTICKGCFHFKACEYVDIEGIMLDKHCEEDCVNYINKDDVILKGEENYGKQN